MMGCLEGASLAAEFVATLEAELRPRFTDTAQLEGILQRLRADAIAAYPEIGVCADVFVRELARRLGELATPEQLEAVRAGHVHLAIACATGDDAAIRRLETDVFDELKITGARLRARSELVDDVRSHVRRLMFTAEPGRQAAVSTFSGRSDLRSYLRVVVTRELARLIDKDRKMVALDDQAIVGLVAPTDGPELGVLRERCRPQVDAAIRAALVGLAESPRALLRYSVVDRWSVDRIAAIFGIHRATAARRVNAARDELATAIRSELATRLAIGIDEVDSIVRLVQSRIDVSIERLLG
jgi:RNA polymerase sigma-70 factor, ECF subfamily